VTHTEREHAAADGDRCPPRKVLKVDPGDGGYREDAGEDHRTEGPDDLHARVESLCRHRIALVVHRTHMQPVCEPAI